MKVCRAASLEFIPASHEDQNRPGVLKKVLFSREQLQEGRVQMVNWSLLPVGSEFRAHYHEDMEEVFIILNGAVEMEISNEKVTLGTGDAIAIAPTEIHTMRNISGEDVHYIVFGITGDKQGKTVVV